MDELDRAQSELGRALGRARSGEDRDLANQVRERGEQVATLLAGLLKLSIHFCCFWVFTALSRK